MWIFDNLFKWQTVDVIRWENPNPDILIWKWDHHLDEIKNKIQIWDYKYL